MPDIAYKNLNLHFKDKGQGKNIVFLHGFLEDLQMWDRLCKNFSKTHRVILIDLLGHGKTGNLGYIHSMESQAEMLKFLLDHLGIEKCILVGHSMGGYVSLAFADAFPDQVLGLCLMNSTAMEDSDEKKINRDRGISAVKQNHRTFIRLAIPNLFSEKNRGLYSKQIAEITQEALKMSQQGIIAALEGMKIRSNKVHILEEADFPVLMIIGEQDPALDFNSSLQQASINTVEKVIFPDGHMSHFENEHELWEALQTWVDSIINQD